MFIEANDILDDLLILDVEVHLLEVKFIDLADGSFIKDADLKKSVV